MTAVRSTDPELTPIPRTSGIDEATRAARRVITALLRTGDNGDDDPSGGRGADLGRITARLDDIADDLERVAPDTADRLAAMWRESGVNRHDPASGSENPIAPPMQLTGNEDGSVSGTVTLGLPYQGPPGHVHGGVSALLLDHALGVANHWGGLSGMTAELTLRYRRPVPLFEPLTITGRQLSTDGRKISTIGSVSARGEECVTAEGVFIAKQLPLPD